MKLFTALLLMMTLGLNSAFATDLGVFGETYTIIEMDFLDFIQFKVNTMKQNGQWHLLEENLRHNMTQYRDRPKQVKNVTRTNETKQWEFDPSIVLDHDITTPEGKLVASAGTSVNPLDSITLSKILIFYNGDDPEQVEWVREKDKQCKGKDKLILVNGSVLTQEKLFKKPVYFDQAGKITVRFKIQHVPAIVAQKGKILVIKEVAL